MSDKKQSETEQPRQQNKVWPRVKGIIWPWVKGIIWIIMIALGSLSLFICWFYLSPERRAANDHPALILYLIGLAFIGGVVLCIPRIITSNPKKYFITRVLVTGITGGAFALLLPIAVKSTTTGVGGLRHSILLATGGLLAILTLGETRRKNDIDKRKNKQEKKKNDKDYRRQVRAERRERYAKAVEQLGDEKAPIRIGGVYTLVGLVDEWLEDESIDKYEDRLKEGQVIINNLCAYIRSPFTLASHYDELSQDTPTTEVIYKDIQQKSHKKWQIISNNLYACIRSRFTPDSRHDELSQDSYIAFYKDKEQEFYADKANLKSEADVRLSIIKEIHNRLQGPDENAPGAWSDFEYDFSGSTFFYPIDLTNSYYTKPVTFGRSTYQGKADFSNSTYEGWVNFSGSTYEGWVNFSNSTCQGEADFSSSTYGGWVNFSNSTYEKDVIFSTYLFRSTYGGWVNFSKSIYLREAYFNDSIYKDKGKGVNFSKSIYKGKANFSKSIYKSKANFSNSTYEKDIIFSVPFLFSTYRGWTDFSNSIYLGKTNFSSSIYLAGTNFSGSIFYSETYFNKDGDNGGFSRFTDCAPQFYDETNHKNTLFGSPNNDFTVENGRGYPIYRNLEGLPLGCKFLTSEQKEYLEGKLQEIEKINNKLFEVKDLAKKTELLKKLRSLYKELRKWREKVTTVKVEDVVAEDTKS